MSYSLTGNPAAERVERFLIQHADRMKAGANTSDTIADYDPNVLTASDLRAVLEELHEYRRAVSAVWAIPQQFGAGDYNRALTDARKALAEHVTGLGA